MKPILVKFIGFAMLAQTANSAICNINAPGLPDPNPPGSSPQPSDGVVVTLENPPVGETLNRGEYYTATWTITGNSLPHWNLSIRNADGTLYKDYQAIPKDHGNGNFSGTFLVPRDIEPGTFQVEVTDTKTDASDRHSVTFN